MLAREGGASRTVTPVDTDGVPPALSEAVTCTGVSFGTAVVVTVKGAEVAPAGMAIDAGTVRAAVLENR